MIVLGCLCHAMGSDVGLMSDMFACDLCFIVRLTSRPIACGYEMESTLILFQIIVILIDDVDSVSIAFTHDSKSVLGSPGHLAEYRIFRQCTQTDNLNREWYFKPMKPHRQFRVHSTVL
jgi:hypothetical protein